MLFILLASPPHPRAILCSGLCPGAPGNGFALCFLAPSRIQAIGKLKEVTRAWKSRGPILCCISDMSFKASTPGNAASTSPTLTKPWNHCFIPCFHSLRMLTTSCWSLSLGTSTSLVCSTNILPVRLHAAPSLKSCLIPSR